MTTEQQQDQYITNPYTGRLIKKGSKVYKRLVSAKLLDADPTANTTENNTVLETDTPSEAQAVKTKMNKKAIGKDKVLTTRGKKVLKASRRPTQQETIDKVSNYAISSVVDHKEELMNTRMSDEQMEGYIRGMIAKKLIGSYEKKKKKKKEVVEYSSESE